MSTSSKIYTLSIIAMRAKPILIGSIMEFASQNCIVIFFSCILQLDQFIFQRRKLVWLQCQPLKGVKKQKFVQNNRTILMYTIWFNTYGMRRNSIRRERKKGNKCLTTPFISIDETVFAQKYTSPKFHNLIIHKFIMHTIF